MGAGLGGPQLDHQRLAGAYAYTLKSFRRCIVYFVEKPLMKTRSILSVRLDDFNVRGHGRRA